MPKSYNTVTKYHTANIGSFYFTGAKESNSQHSEDGINYKKHGYYKFRRNYCTSIPKNSQTLINTCSVLEA